MQSKKYTLKNGITITYCPPNICPLCNAGVANDVSFEGHINDQHGCTIQFCTVTHCYACDSFFLSVYKYSSKDNMYYPDKLFPHQFKPSAFPEHIKKLSPDFISLYRESEQAEAEGLFGICGMGYRKAIEFLIKDYLIMQANISPDTGEEDINKIKRLQLSQAINQISDARVKNLAFKATWLGNDQAHYQKKFKNRDVSDMKKFIKAMIYCIELEITLTEEL